MIDIIKNFKKYLPLLKELVNKELKTKYRRSVLGYLWSLLNPLFTMIIVSAVFSYMFKNQIPHYPVYLVIGQVFWGFFSEATNSAMRSILGASELLKKAYMPKYIFPLSKILFSIVNLFYSLLAVVIVIIFSRFTVTPAITAVPVGIFLFAMFTTGFGLFLSIFAVYFRDMLHLYSVVLTGWMYLTPIFYSVKSLSPAMMKFVYCNPLFLYIEYFRMAIYDGVLPSFKYNLICFLVGIIPLALSILFFKKRQDGLILYL